MFVDDGVLRDEAFFDMFGGVDVENEEDIQLSPWDARFVLRDETQLRLFINDVVPAAGSALAQYSEAERASWVVEILPQSGKTGEELARARSVPLGVLDSLTFHTSLALGDVHFTVTVRDEAEGKMLARGVVIGKTFAGAREFGDAAAPVFTPELVVGGELTYRFAVVTVRPHCSPVLLMCGC